jgi:hypothetical protein
VLDEWEKFTASNRAMNIGSQRHRKRKKDSLVSGSLIKAGSLSKRYRPMTAINIKGTLNNVFVENRKSAERISIADQLSLLQLSEMFKRLFMRLLINLSFSYF